MRRPARTSTPATRSSPAGTLIGAAELGALAAGGNATVACARRPRVAVLLTGDELVEPDRELAPGQIHDSNAYAVPPLATVRRRRGRTSSR